MRGVSEKVGAVLALVGLLLASVACGSDRGVGVASRVTVGSSISNPIGHEIALGDTPTRMTVEVLARYPHDSGSFTQGLVFDDHGNLFESVGKYGRSKLRRVEVAPGDVEQEIDLDGKYFAEGLAFVDGKLIVITWKENTAIVFDASSFDEVERFTYDGEGWGLCYDGADLVMSDGSADLVFRAPGDFHERRRVTVTEAGTPVRNLNELECVGGRIFANQWRTDRILEIDPSDGAVTAIVDAGGLLDVNEAEKADVLNGIAYDEKAGTFLITGKNWPWMFEVRFVE